MKQRRIVAFSGSAAARAMVRSLAADGGDEIVTVTVDLGQPLELGQVRDAALAAGATRAHVLDAREEFARHHLLPALQAGVAADGWLPLLRTLGQPLVAAKLREIAAIEEAPIAVDAQDYDVDASMAGRIADGGAYTLTKSAAAAAEVPADVEVTFDGGVPVAINDVAMPLTELFESLATIAGQHGVGRLDAVEAPAAVLLQAVLQAQVNGKGRVKLLKGTIADFHAADSNAPHSHPEELVAHS